MKPITRSQLLLTVPLLLLASCCMLSGCGGGDSEVDTEVLLDQHGSRARRHDPENFVEVELGDFFVTRQVPNESNMFYVRCQMFAVTPRQEQEALTEALEQRRTRMRDTVIAVIQKTEIDALSEPSMNWMKAEIIPAINKVLRTNTVRDVVVSQFSLERG